MELSKSNRILILLAIDTLFFLLEIVVGKLLALSRRPNTSNCATGYAVHSLALVADSFHMVCPS